MNRINPVALASAALVAACAAMPYPASAQMVPQGATTRPPTTAPNESPRPPQMVQGTRRPGGVLQGFSVVLVVGDLQGTSATDDVPIAARKALTDMREFLPYKSYRLLDAGWLMCCGERAPASERRPPTEAPMARSLSTLALRGPDEQEYELRLASGRAENARVFVNFTLIGSGTPVAATAAASATANRTLQRRIADAEDKTELLRKQIADAKRRVEVGVAPGSDIPKMELELRSAQRELAEMRERLETNAAYGPGGGNRGSADRIARTAVIDTSFTMDVGETVVVGASRPRGATKALIALVTAVPRSSAGSTRD
jgi:hypothetical protein